MPTSFEGILRGDRIDWTGRSPRASSPLRVRVTVVEPEEAPSGRGRQMAGALAGLAETGGIAGIENPIEWEREQRADRPLPGADR